MTRIVAGVDIGNTTTEVCIAEIGGSLRFLSSAIIVTTGIKGTPENAGGVASALSEACGRASIHINDLDEILINRAVPVIGDVAMETITETVVTHSAMIGHNPNTPGGYGAAAGILERIENIGRLRDGVDYILISEMDYTKTAEIVNTSSKNIVGLVLQKDEAVLVENRLNKKIPIVDEVKKTSELPSGSLAAIEVALPGESVRMLSNPYGIATLLDLTPEETKTVMTAARSLIGKKSGVVIKSPGGHVRMEIVPAGEIYIEAAEYQRVSVDAGADKIMERLAAAGEVRGITGERHTNIGNMFEKITNRMRQLTETGDIYITDLLAVDGYAHAAITGASAGETCMEKCVGIAAMVKAGALQMERIAQALSRELSISVNVAGVEAVMAALGALTTPGASLPLAVLDLGGGSTDAAIILKDGTCRSIQHAGAGELVTLLIQSELGIEDKRTAEQIKIYPAAKVESLFHARQEDGRVIFFEKPLEPKFFGSVVLLTGGSMIKLDLGEALERIVHVRREAKKKVFVQNSLRCLRDISDGDIKSINNVVLVGGSAEDFEITEMLTEALAQYRIVCGRGNIRRTEGSRNAVATGLLISYAESAL